VEVKSGEEESSPTRDYTSSLHFTDSLRLPTFALSGVRQCVPEQRVVLPFIACYLIDCDDHQSGHPSHRSPFSSPLSSTGFRGPAREGESGYENGDDSGSRFSIHHFHAEHNVMLSGARRASAGNNLFGNAFVVPLFRARTAQQLHRELCRQLLRS
jgi:hypothetical protein